MPNFFYYDEEGRKQGTYTTEQIQLLARNGAITPETIIEAESGNTIPAGKIKGLTFGKVSHEVVRIFQDADVVDEMEKWYYYDESGNKQGAFYTEQIRYFAEHGLITPNTIIETESGETKLAETLKWLENSLLTWKAKLAHPNHDNSDTNIQNVDDLDEEERGRLKAEVKLSDSAIILSIVAHFIVMFSGNVVPESTVMSIISLIAMLGTIIFSIVCMVRLAKLMHFETTSIVLLAICVPIPIIYFIPLYLVYSRADNLVSKDKQTPNSAVSVTEQGSRLGNREANDISSDRHFGQVICPNCQTLLEYTKIPSPECITSTSDKLFIWGCVALIFFFPLALLLWFLSMLTSGGQRDLFQTLQCETCGHHFRSHWKGKV